MNERYTNGPMWQVSGAGRTICVRAENWILALGSALSGGSAALRIRRMACEQFHNGDVIVHDLTSGHRYVLQRLTALVSLSDEFIAPLEEDEETEEVFTMEEALEREFLLLGDDLTEEVYAGASHTGIDESAMLQDSRCPGLAMVHRPTCSTPFNNSASTNASST